MSRYILPVAQGLNFSSFFQSLRHHSNQILYSTCPGSVPGAVVLLSFVFRVYFCSSIKCLRNQFFDSLSLYPIHYLFKRKLSWSKSLNWPAKIKLKKVTTTHFLVKSGGTVGIAGVPNFLTPLSRPLKITR